MGPPPVNTALPPNVSPATMAGHMNPSQQYPTGGVAPTQAPAAGVPQSVVGQTAREYAGATDQSMQTAGGPAVPQQTPGVQTQLQFRPSGPQGALPPNMSSPAQQRGPPPAQSSIVSHPMAVQQESVQSPMDQAMATFNQSPSAHSTANPSNINYANEVLAQYYNSYLDNSKRMVVV